MALQLSQSHLRFLNLSYTLIGLFPRGKGYSGSQDFNIVFKLFHLFFIIR